MPVYKIYDFFIVVLNEIALRDVTSVLVLLFYALVSYRLYPVNIILTLVL